MTKIPIACSLSPTAAADQLDEWRALEPSALQRVEIDGGIALTFPLGLAERVRALAAREATCCAFLSLIVADEGETVRLTITSDQAAAAPVIAALAGTGEPDRPI